MKHEGKTKKIFVRMLALIMLLSACTGKTKRYNPEDFEIFFEGITALNHAITLLYWDMETGGMPPDALESKAKTISILETELYDLKTSETMPDFF
jgi:Zn-dependent M32 family carboxypeptidase